MAPLPKPPEQRRRRNKAQSSWRQLPQVSEVTVPGLPAGAWLESTLAWWETIWASPMASAWLPADVPTLVRLAVLVDAVSAGNASAALLGEIRQLEDRFGLSPKSRRALQWEVERAAEGAAPVKLAEVRRLRAIDPAS